MTSANVVEYNIYDKDNNEVGYHRQNVMCSTCNDGLDKYQPSKLYYNGIWLWWGGRLLARWFYEPRKWLLRNPASITFRNFEPGGEN
jgi:hypothetical protein